MYTRDLTSLQHPIVKHLVKLRTERAYRREQGHLLIPGMKLVQELSGIKTLLVEQGTPIPPSLSAEQIFFVTHDILKKVTGLQAPESIAAEIPLPAPYLPKGLRTLIILDGINDPGNVGTLFRTAAALEIDALFLTPNTSDPFNDKALRAAKGATFKIPFVEGNYDTLLSLLQEEQLPLWIADGSGKDIRQLGALPRFALALGNETHGVSSLLHPHGTLVGIPISKAIESLNVSAAGAILIDRMQRGPA